MHKHTITLILLLACYTLAWAQDSIFTGYATCTIKQGHVEFSTYGFQDKALTKPYDTATIQPVGSVSKTVIGLAIMKAQELGMLHLDADINQYLDFWLVNPNVANNIPITLRHLATHTSGIRDHEKYYLKSYTKSLQATETLEAYLKSYLIEGGSKYSKKNFGSNIAGKEYSYSNIGAALAAYVVERASNLSFDQFTETYIFQPLGMRDTHWFFQENKRQRYTMLFDEKDSMIEFYACATYPEGSLKTTVKDLSLLLQALMRGYAGTAPILEKKSWETYFAKNFPENAPIKGLNLKEPNSGIFIVYAKSGAIGHTGSDPGVSAFMFFNPETTEGKIFMANEDLTPKNLDASKRIWSSL